MSQGRAGGLVRELSLDAMEWAISDILEGAEGILLQSGDMNDDN